MSNSIKSTALRYLLYLSIGLASILISCGDAQPISDVERMRAAYIAAPSDVGADSLLYYCAKEIEMNPSATSSNAALLVGAADALESAGAIEKAAGAIVASIKQFYNTPDIEDRIIRLEGLYQKLNNSDASMTTMNSYLAAFPNGKQASAYTTALGDQKMSITDRLAQVGQEIVNNPDAQSGLNTAAVRKYIGISEIYALTNADRDSMSTDYLFKAGKLAMTIGAADKAQELYRWIYQIFPNSKDAPGALFTHGFTLDNQLGKKAEAKAIYEHFVNTYPDHHFADDAQFQLDNLGKSTEEIMKNFESK